MDSHEWIMFHHPSRAAYNSGSGVLCDLAMIYNKAFVCLFVVVVFVCLFLGGCLFLFKNSTFIANR